MADTTDRNSPDASGSVRLKFFLARQSEGRGNRRARRKQKAVIPEQQAAILAALALMERYGGSMQSKEIGTLLNVSTERLSNVLRGEMAAAGLVTKIDGHYRITEKGLRQLAEFADEVLGAPRSIEQELQNHAPYRGMIEFAERLVDRDLRTKFDGARDARLS